MVVLGSGESGVGSAILAKQKGFEVFVSDKGLIKEKYKIQLEKENIKAEKIGEINARIELLQSIRLKKQGEISDLFEDFQTNCVKNK